MAKITRNLPFSDYLSIEAVHFSSLKSIDVSPKHYAHAKRVNRPDTEALTIGRVLHSMLLDPSPPDVAIYEGKTRQGKAWEAFATEHKGKTILKRSELESTTAMREAVLADPVAGPLLFEGSGEVTVQWHMLGHACKGRVDWLRPNGAPVELKSTRHNTDHGFVRDCASLLYHAQLAFYWGGLTAALGHEPPELPALITVEKQPPYDVVVYRIGYDTIEAGQRKIDLWMKRLDEARRTQRWPGRAQGPVDFRLPDYTLGEGSDVDLAGLEYDNDDD